ncbi:endo-1,4-beta-xylanase [Dyadobacter arcticus]|nr:endo-1,4-beta-xylanase [Dyadobacter arcticus]
MFNYFFFMLLTAASITAAGAQVSILPADSLAFTANTKSAPKATFRQVIVNNQPFKSAYHIDTGNEAGLERFTLSYPIDEAVREGDVLLLSLYSRSLQSKKETGESFIELSLDRTIAGKYEWPPLLERGISFGSEWLQTQIPFVASKNVPRGTLSLVIKCGGFPQEFELADVSLINYQQTKKRSDLPRSIVHYDGDAPDAPWRKAAEARIEKFRKGDLKITILDSNGRPIPDALVSVNLKKIAFGWGTATNSKLILDTLNPETKQYRDTLLRYFNKVVFENEMKSKYWATSNHEQTKKVVAWLTAHEIPARGHVMVWPSWQHSPNLVRFKEDTDALDAGILDLIQDQTNVMKKQFVEWDVVNEPFAHHDITDALGGRKKLVNWFLAARENTPGVKLFLNEYTMFHSEGRGSEDFYDNLNYLITNHAPIDGIGEQAHIGGTPPGIEFIIKKLDRFGMFGLPIQITEFDITSDDDDFKARYMHDFMTAIFSHPATIGFMQWGFWEKAHWIPAAALWDRDWHIRPQGEVFKHLVSEAWTTHVNGVTDNNGQYMVRAFSGEYEITVRKGNRHLIQHTNLTSKGETLSIKLE